VIDEGDDLLTTGEMARRSSNTLRTVRFYEEEGILRPARRTEGGHRLFRSAELDRLMFVSDLRMAGLSLEEIKAILALKQGSSTGGEAATHTTRLLNERISELEQKLAVLTRLRQDLARTSDIMTGCLGCQDSKFPHHCETCTIMTSPPELPRCMRVLWSSRKVEGEEGVGGEQGASDQEAP
jgi:DNA-binding transcriptional MerR regulator